MRIKDEQTMLVLGSHLANICRPPCSIHLQGNLGAGKTTLTRGFLAALGYSGRVKSPTYSLLEVYNLKDLQIIHLDLYRIMHPDELEHLGLRDLITEHTIAIVEWPELGQGKVPPPDLTCVIEMLEDERVVTFQATTKRGEQILTQLATQVT